MNTEAEKLFKADQKEAAVKVLVQDLNQNSRQLPKILQLSTYLVALGDLEQAEDLIQRGLALFPKEKDLRYNLGNVYFVAEKFDQASQLFQELINDDYGFEAYFMEAKTLSKQDQKQLAIVYALTAVEKNPTDLAASELLADLLLANGNFAEALDYYRQANQLQAQAKFYFNMALCQMNLNQEYQSTLAQAKQLDPGFYQQHVKKIADLQNYLKTGDRDDRS